MGVLFHKDNEIVQKVYRGASYERQKIKDRGLVQEV